MFNNSPVPSSTSLVESNVIAYRVSPPYDPRNLGTIPFLFRGDPSFWAAKEVPTHELASPFPPSLF